jgi:SpoVK/Ycf46/Vps4 family AAA+-type ATPase
MATAEQIKSLIRSHLYDETDRFRTIALQLAAHEAGQGHGALAHEIRNLLDKTQPAKSAVLLKFPPDLQGLVLSSDPDTPRSALVLPTDLADRVQRVTHEYRQQQLLKSHGLMHRRKILLIGPPGTGKTMTARILAHELRLPLRTIQVDRLVTKFMGETAAKLRQIFDLIQQEAGVYLFDEFDAIGGERSLDNDVGEMRRVLNAFLQFIEQDTSDNVIVAATNSPKLLDRALFRRFDDVLYFELPEPADRKRLIQNVLGTFLPPKFAWPEVLARSEGLSHAEIDTACRDAIKQGVLTKKPKISGQLLCQMLKERHSTQAGRKG